LISSLFLALRISTSRDADSASLLLLLPTEQLFSNYAFFSAVFAPHSPPDYKVLRSFPFFCFAFPKQSVCAGCVIPTSIDVGRFPFSPVG
jgi:hypothetical protein